MSSRKIVLDNACNCVKIKQMADFIKITKTGFIPYEWDGDLQEYKSKPSETVIGDLRSRCEIDEDVTLGDIFQAVDNDPLIKHTIAAYAWCGAIDRFHVQAKEPNKPHDVDDTTLTELNIEAFAGIHCYDGLDGCHAVPDSFEGITMDFSGIAANGQTYSVSMSPMYKLASLPVRIQKTITITKNFEPLLTASYEPSLLEVLDAIYWDISFYGNPEQTADFFEELKERSKEVEDGTATLVPFNFHEDDDEETPENNKV
jgi:hypothetical protein